MSNIIFPKTVELKWAEGRPGNKVICELTDNDFKVGEKIQFQISGRLVVGKIEWKRERLIGLEILDIFEVDYAGSA
jgi:hypothetical protein